MHPRYFMKPIIGPKDWKGCLEVLKEYLPKVQGDTDKAIVYLKKIGELQELIGRADDALDSFGKSSDLDQDILESVENMIEIHIFNQN